MNAWQGRIDPSRIFGNLYFVGTRPASTHLIDTGDGLIMIDSGYPESLYQVIHNMWLLGFNPKDIRYILHSHGHIDHFGGTRALVELTGARTFIGEADAPIADGTLDLSFAAELGMRYTQTFTPDVLLRDGDRITLGNTDILCVSTPGHTEGTLSFFFDVTDGKKTYRAGMHGGVGTNTMQGAWLRSRGLSFECRQKFLLGLDRVQNEKVELFIGNHVGNNQTEEKLARIKTEKENPFIDPNGNEWRTFITLCRQNVHSLIENDKE